MNIVVGMLPFRFWLKCIGILICCLRESMCIRMHETYVCRGVGQKFFCEPHPGCEPPNQMRTPFFVPSLALSLFLYQLKSFSRRWCARKFLIVSILIIIWFIRRHPLSFAGHFKNFSDFDYWSNNFDYSEICAAGENFFEKCPLIRDFQ